METKVNKECVLRNVLEYCFNDKLKQSRILKGFLSSCRKGGDLAEDVKVLRAVLKDDAVAYTAGTVSEYQLSRIRPIIERFSSEMSSARQEIYNAKRRRMQEEEKSKLRGSEKPLKSNIEKSVQRLNRIERKENEKEFHRRVGEVVVAESLKRHIKSEYAIFNIVEHYRYIKHTGNGWDEHELNKCLLCMGYDDEAASVLKTYGELCGMSGGFEGFLEFLAYGIFIPSPSVYAANLARAAMEARLLAQTNEKLCSSLRDFFRWEPRARLVKAAPAIPKTKKRLRSAK